VLNRFKDLGELVMQAKLTKGAFSPVTVITPTQGGTLDVTRFLARELADRGGLVNVRAATLASLATELFLNSGETRGRREATLFLREAAARASLAENPSLFGALALRQATVRAVSSTSASLDGISPSDLIDVSTNPLFAEIVSHHTNIRRALEPTCYFPDEVLSTAARRLEEATVREKLGTVIIFPFPFLAGRRPSSRPSKPQQTHPSSRRRTALNSSTLLSQEPNLSI
jgi:hypothetical protein